MPHIFKTLADTDAASFCAGTDDPAALRRQLDSSLRAGSTCPAWCWLAIDATARVRARNIWWGRHDAMRPIGVDLVSIEEPAATAALLRHARDHLGVDDALCCITAPTEEGDDPSVTRADLVAVLTACGFGLEVSRVMVARSASSESEVAFDPEGEPVGYVVPGFADETPMIGEIGVAASHRGNGYADDLLGWATRLLVSSGAERIIADTDRANTPMRAAFKRAGYRESRWRDDYQWQRETPHAVARRIPSDTTIKTARLELTPLQVGDATEMAHVLRDERLHEFIGGHPATLRELEERYRRLVAEPVDPGQIWLNWIARDRHSRAAIGTMQATVDTAAGSSAAEVAWIIGATWQGQGFAKEAARAVVEWLRSLGISDITAHVHPSHHASAAVAHYAGLRPTAAQDDGETVWRRS